MHGATESSEREAWERTVEQIDKPTGPNSRAAKRWPEAGETPCRWETSSRDAPTSDRGKLGDEWETITSARTAVPGKLRYKLLKLGEDTWRERRYFEPDLEALLEAN